MLEMPKISMENFMQIHKALEIPQIFRKNLRSKEYRNILRKFLRNYLWYFAMDHI